MSTSRPARTLISLVRGYQTVRAGRLSPCRFVPSCSEYAIEAVQVHGTSRGAWLAIRRICRCNPFGRYGSDPVPASTRPLPTHIHQH